MANSRAQIVATIGPASKSADVLKKMVARQMDVARLNFSHGTYEEHAEYIANIRQAAADAGKKVPIIQDLSGPREKTTKGHQFHKGAAKAFTEKDKKDLEFGLSQNIEYVAMSYVGNADDILEVRNFMKEIGHVKPIIAKIERGVALDNIDEIIKTADAIMVARGDLGLSISLEKVPFAQQMIIKKCNAAGKPVITATQMLISMVGNPEPTRAEVADVTQAILEGSDAVMLSEETAIGKYPVETVAEMEKIVLESEKHLKRKVNLLQDFADTADAS